MIIIAAIGVFAGLMCGIFYMGSWVNEVLGEDEEYQYDENVCFWKQTHKVYGIIK